LGGIGRDCFGLWFASEIPKAVAGRLCGILLEFAVSCGGGGYGGFGGDGIGVEVVMGDILVEVVMGSGYG